MRITYDPKADAMYIYVREAKVARTEEMEPGVMRDLDDQGQVIGVEVLSVRQRIDKRADGWTVHVPAAQAG